jgi:hypothetical protein
MHLFLFFAYFVPLLFNIGAMTYMAKTKEAFSNADKSGVGKYVKQKPYKLASTIGNFLLIVTPFFNWFMVIAVFDQKNSSTFDQLDVQEQIKEEEK